MKSFKEWAKNKELNENENDLLFGDNSWKDWINNMGVEILNKIKSAEESGDIAHLMELQSAIDDAVQNIKDPFVLEKFIPASDAVKKAIYSFKSKGHGYPGGGG